MRMSKFFTALFAVAMFSVITSFKPAEITKAEWKFIGDKNVRFGVDKDVIPCGNANDDFRQIKLKVTDGPVKILDMKVYFDNDEVQDVSFAGIYARVMKAV